MLQYDLNKIYVGETKQDVFFFKNQIPSIWPFKDNQDHKDKNMYIDTSRKKLPSAL